MRKYGYKMYSESKVIPRVTENLNPKQNKYKQRRKQRTCVRAQHAHTYKQIQHL